MITMINAKMRNMKPEELQKLLDKLNNPEPEEEEGEKKEGGEHTPPAHGQPIQAPKPGESQQGKGVHDYGKEKKS
jgi:hypothetical protein